MSPELNGAKTASFVTNSKTYKILAEGATVCMLRDLHKSFGSSYPDFLISGCVVSNYDIPRCYSTDFLNLYKNYKLPSGSYYIFTFISRSLTFRSRLR